MIEVTDAEQVERLNSRVMELLRERDALVKALEEIVGLTVALRQGGPDPMDLQGLSEALEHATNIAHDAIHGVVGSPRGQNQ